MGKMDRDRQGTGGAFSRSLTWSDGVGSRSKQTGLDEVVVKGGVVPADVRQELVALDGVLQRQVLLARPVTVRTGRGEKGDGGWTAENENKR